MLCPEAQLWAGHWSVVLPSSDQNKAAGNSERRSSLNIECGLSSVSNFFFRINNLKKKKYIFS